MTPPAAPRAILPTHRVLSACLVMGEPTLEELLAEPIMLMRMRSAAVTAQELRDLCGKVRETVEAARRTQSLGGTW